LALWLFCSGGFDFSCSTPNVLAILLALYHLFFLCEIRTHDLSRRPAAYPRLRPRGHWDRHKIIMNKNDSGELFYHMQNHMQYLRQVM
jgi:hypothetical protein